MKWHKGNRYRFQLMFAVIGILACNLSSCVSKDNADPQEIVADVSQQANSIPQATVVPLEFAYPDNGQYLETEVPSTLPLPTPTYGVNELELARLTFIANLGTLVIQECRTMQPFSAVVKKDLGQGDLEPLILTSQANVLLPALSNGSRQIAYGVSFPTQIVSGTQRIDGLDKLVISNYPEIDHSITVAEFESLDINAPVLNSCDERYRFVGRPLWSPDDRLLFFSYFRLYQENYLFDTLTSSLLLLESRTDIPPVWINENTLVFSDVRGLLVSSFEGQGVNSSERVEVSEETLISRIGTPKLGQWRFIPLNTTDQNIYFELYNTESRDIDSIWVLDRDTRILEFEHGLRDESWLHPTIGEYWAVACTKEDSDSLLVLDVRTWREIGQIMTASGENISCRKIWAKDHAIGESNELYIAISTSLGNIYITQVQPDISEFKIALPSSYYADYYLPYVIDLDISISQ